jgi:hypothetical protein
MRSSCRVALKEWEGLCRRLGEGRQILLLRKGGLREGAGGFRPGRPSFVLFPTRFHEQGEAPPDRVLISLFAELAELRRVEDPVLLEGLEEEHGLSREDVERRFRYGRAPGLNALFLRVWRLPRPSSIDGSSRYEGCRSWVDLEEEVGIDGAEPAIAEAAFRGRLETLLARISG